MKIQSVANNIWKPVSFAHRLQLAAALAVAAGLLVTGCATAPHAPAPTSKTQQLVIAPAQALEKLEAGNARFVAGKTLHRDWPQQRAQTASGQYPFAVV